MHISQLDYLANSVKYPAINALKYISSRVTSSLPLIGVGGIKSLDNAEQAMELGADIVAIGRSAIGNRNLPKTFASAEELPNQNPFPETHLKQIGISQNFINYLRKWPVSTLNVIK